jgi:DNA-binding PadR family transcriptional regulator
MTDPRSFLPLHPNDFQILLSLVEEARHGYGIVKEVERASDGRIRMDPANLYRSIKRMIGSGLVEEAESPAGEEDERRRYYGISALGLSVARLEAARLADAAAAARALHLIPDER